MRLQWWGDEFGNLVDTLEYFAESNECTEADPVFWIWAFAV